MALKHKITKSSCARRPLLLSAASTALTSIVHVAAAQARPGSTSIRAVTDPRTYSALVYTPPGPTQPLPMLLVLHGAGNNEAGIWTLADPNGEHAGLAPTLLSSGNAPAALADNFAVVTPFVGNGKRSFYEEPRSKLLEFVEWVCSDEGRRAGCPEIDPTRRFLFGFSDGATVGMELATTLRFRAVAVAAYGFTGQELPALALERLRDLPIWVFHSADDVIFSVANSDRLVSSLRRVSSRPNVVRYTRFERDQEGFTGAIRGHSTGITASKMPKLYEWFLSVG